MNYLYEYSINADSKPILDGWGWDEYWMPEDWIEWHTMNKKKYGKEAANNKLIKEYHKASFGAASYDWRTFDTTFKNYAKLNNFYDGLFSGLGGAIMKPINTAASAADTVITSAGNVVENTAKGAEKTSKVIKYGLPILGVATGLGLIAYGYNRWIKPNGAKRVYK